MIYWDAIEEQRRWDGRERRVNNPYPTLIGTTNLVNQQDQLRGSNRTSRTLIRPREEESTQPTTRPRIDDNNAH